MTTVAPYGSWTSPITTDLLVEKVVSLANPLPAGGSVYFVEGRPSEGGRQVIVRLDPDGSLSDVLPEGFSARTTVHEYGGLSYALSGEDVYFSNFSDQRLYRIRPGEAPVPITAAPATPTAVRYAAPILTRDGALIICVRERHEESEVVNELVAIPTELSSTRSADLDTRVIVLASGHDFYGAPALSPDARRIAWCCWDHPQMPWDGTELYEADLSATGLGEPRLIAGGATESVTQPRYSPDGVLHFVSDRTGWWNLYATDDADWRNGRPLAARAAEFASPDWELGLSSYTFSDSGALVATWSEAGHSHLGVLRPGEVDFEEILTPLTVFRALAAESESILCVAASPTDPPAVVRVEIPSGKLARLRLSRESGVDPGYLSVPEPMTFPTSDSGDEVHALVYLPANPDFAPEVGERPPLLISIHGGPTSSASPVLNYGVQYWTSRGFVVADVDYRGSSGYGRAYRELLKGQWGIADVQDCESVALSLATAGLADSERLCIHGGSAGGYTTLCAAAFGEVFAAGASYFGVADAAALAIGTHKFESRYLDGLIGPWPEAAERYEERSPLFHLEQIHTPLILFQGLEDRVVPPTQAEAMVAALRSQGVPVAYLAYPGEQHGFRMAENIKRTAEAELYFYGRVLGFDPAGSIEPVPIDNEAAILPPAPRTV